MKTNNMITATALIRKDKIIEVGGYSIAARYINEDWHLWLRFMQRGYNPVKMNFYGFWYRRKQHHSLLKEINDTNSPENIHRVEALKIEADKINTIIKSIDYPADLETPASFIEISNIISVNADDHNNILIFLPHLKTDPYSYNLVSEFAKKGFNITIITTEICPYIHRQKYEKIATVFDLTTFLNKSNWLYFIKYILSTRNISSIYNYNCKYVSNIKDSLTDIKYEEYYYEEDNSEYFILKKKYQNSKKLSRRIIRKIIRIMKGR